MWRKQRPTRAASMISPRRGTWIGCWRVSSNYVVISGTATCHDQDIWDEARRIIARYRAADQVDEYLARWQTEPRVLITVTPERISTRVPGRRRPVVKTAVASPPLLHGERNEQQYQLAGNAPQLYERETVHTLARPLAELMFAYISLQAGDRVLDAACGTGIVTRVAVQRYGDLGHVVGVDLNAGILEVARANASATPVPIEWRHGDVCALPFADASFEVVLCQQGLQFVPDPGAALREMRRVLVPVGRLAFTVFSEIPAYYAALANALARHVSADAATSCLSRITLREATTLRQLVEDAGFSAIEMRVLEVMRRMPASAVSVVEGMARAPYARDVAAVEEAARQAVGSEVSAALHAYRDGDEVVIPHRSHLVHARVA